MIGYSLKARKMRSSFVLWLFRLAAWLTACVLGAIIVFLVIKGAGAISWGFLTEFPRNSMTEGGIFPAIVGTVYLTLGALLLALPLGVATAIYLNEYSRSGKVAALIRLSVTNLAGVPSIIFGLFGLALFVSTLGLGISLLSGSLTLALLILPTIISASEEALKQIPLSFREASFALGASRWQTIAKVVLPAAAPGIITGSILGLARAAGETAPIMYTAATFYTAEPVADLILMFDGVNNNVIDLRIDQDISKQYSQVTVLGQSAGGSSGGAGHIVDATSGESSSGQWQQTKGQNALQASVQDERLLSLSINRPLAVVDSNCSQAEALRKAKKLLADGQMESLTITATVRGHRTDSGLLWNPGQRVNLVSEPDWINGTFFMTAREFIGGENSGQITELTLKPDKTWLPELAAQSKSRSGASGGGNSSSGRIVVVTS